MDLAAPTWPEFSGPVRGIVTRAPIALGAVFEVAVPSFSDRHSYEIRNWMPRGELLPAVGDIALLVEDDQSEPWVVAWEPV